MKVSVKCDPEKKELHVAIQYLRTFVKNWKK